MRRKFYLTTEFWIIAAMQIFFLVAILESLDAHLIVCAITVLVSSYFVSRAIYKRNRPSLVKRPFLCSEFYFGISGSLLVGLAFITGKANFDFCVLMVTIMLANFVVSRGIVKSEGRLITHV